MSAPLAHTGTQNLFLSLFAAAILHLLRMRNIKDKEVEVGIGLVIG